MRKGSPLQSRDLLNAAKEMLEIAKSRPDSDSFMRRATSAAYYATFHCLAESCAMFIAGEYDDGSNSDA